MSEGLIKNLVSDLLSGVVYSSIKTGKPVTTEAIGEALKNRESDPVLIDRLTPAGFSEIRNRVSGISTEFFGTVNEAIESGSLVPLLPEIYRLPKFLGFITLEIETPVKSFFGEVGNISVAFTSPDSVEAEEFGSGVTFYGIGETRDDSDVYYTFDVETISEANEIYRSLRNNGLEITAEKFGGNNENFDRPNPEEFDPENPKI